MTVPLIAEPLEVLRRRSSTKWRTFGEDVLPMFVAEHDFPMAPAITRALTTAVATGDVGYTPPRSGVGEAYAAFAARRHGWDVDPARTRITGDVMMGVVEVLRRVIEPGDHVIVMTPVYPPFFDTVEEAGGVVERVPLRRHDAGWSMDLDAISDALAGGARTVLLCNPHNPTGTVHTREELARLAELVAGVGGRVVSDEIHGPLVLPGATFTPFLTASDTAAEIGFAITSASKAFNLAGLKCALMIAGSDAGAALLHAMPWEVEWRTGLLGAKAAIAAFDAESDPWLDGLIAALDENRWLLGALLAEHLPDVGYAPPASTYLAWLDVAALRLGPNPAAAIRARGRVALHIGHLFGAEGADFVRMNIGCSPDVIREGVARMAIASAG